jgi:hypothetical protein
MKLLSQLLIKQIKNTAVLYSNIRCREETRLEAQTYKGQFLNEYICGLRKRYTYAQVLVSLRSRIQKNCRTQIDCIYKLYKSSLKLHIMLHNEVRNPDECVFLSYSIPGFMT